MWKTLSEKRFPKIRKSKCDIGFALSSGYSNGFTADKLCNDEAAIFKEGRGNTGIFLKN